MWTDILRIALAPVLVFAAVIILALIFRDPIGHLIRSFRSLRIRKEPGRIEIEIENRVRDLEHRLATKAGRPIPAVNRPVSDLDEADTAVRKMTLETDDEDRDLVEELAELTRKVRSAPRLDGRVTDRYLKLVDRFRGYRGHDTKGGPEVPP